AFAFMMFFCNLSLVSITVIGGLLVIQRVIAIGDIQAFSTYTRQFNQPINQIANIANIVQQTIAAAERVFQLIDEEEEIPETPAGEITSANGAVRFEHVQFGYDDTLLMKDLNIDVKPGQTVAIVGPTGAGKTTMINLLMRFYEVNGR